MPTLTMAQTYTYARQAGFDPAAAVIMAAISMGESGLNPSAIGDVSLQNGTWGPSVGLAQIRTLKSQTGTGKTRDINKLRDPLQNMLAAYDISSKGKDFTPWTVYKTGKYRQFLGQAKTAAKTAPLTNTGQPVIAPAGLPDALTGSREEWTRIGLQLSALVFGGGLVVAGCYLAVS